MKCILSSLQILLLVLLVSCNPTEQTDVDLDGVTSLTSATFSYNASSVELIQNETSLNIYPQKVITGSFEITPTLPEGLSIDPNTGIISGTPDDASSATQYRITATTSSNKFEVAFVTITVLEEPPLTLDYGNTILVFTRDEAGTTFTPTTTGGTPTSYSIDATLPTGLSFDTLTGVISGTPTVVEAGSYQITASNDTGGVTIRVVISVRKAVPDINDADPFDDEPAAPYNVGDTDLVTDPITVNLDTPFVDAEFEIFPNLPEGLSMDPLTGTISGTPTSTNDISTYTVRAYNEVGEDTATLTLSVQDPPTDLTYPPNNDDDENKYVIQKGVPVSIFPLTYEGGTPTYSIDTLPAGLTINAVTGRISGTPTAVEEVDTTVTATAYAQTETYTIEFSVAEDYPEDRTNLGYQSDLTFSAYVAPNDHCVDVSGQNQDTDITLEATCKAVANRAWRDSDGLCVFLDDPAAPTALDTTATDATTCEAIAGHAWIDTSGDANTKPSGDGNKPLEAEQDGEVSKDPRYIISPALPAGLIFDGDTGLISGTPTAVLGETAFTITGFNAYGDEDVDEADMIQTTQTVNITVSESIPQSLGYTPTDPTRCFWNDTLKIFEVQDGVPLEGGAGENCIYPQIPKGSGVPTTYSVIPKLPDGLSLDPTTGIISGTSNEILPVKYYTITGTNDAGSRSETIAISTNTIIAPQSLVYDGDNVIDLTIFTDDEITPAYVGGQGTFTTSVALPTGLTLNANTGVIEGTPLIGYDDGTLPYNAIPITVTNIEGTLTTTIQINIQNASPSGLTYVGTEDYDDASDDDEVVVLFEGDSVDASDILNFSDYNSGNGPGGYFNSYVASPVFNTQHNNTGNNGINLVFEEDGQVVDDEVDNYAADGVTEDPDGINDGVLPTDPGEYDPAAINYTITGTAQNTDGAGTDEDDSDDIQILVVEQPPEIDFSNVNNRVVLQGGQTGTITPLNNGGNVASTNGGAAFAGSCTAQTGGTDVTTEINTDTGQTINFNAGFECEFEQPGAGNCFGGAFSYSTIIEAFNSGTNYATSPNNTANPGQTTAVTVYAVDGPDFTYEPDAVDFAGKSHLTLNASDGTDDYIPTTGACHDGDFTLTTLSNLPSPMVFSGSDGQILMGDNALVGRRDFVLSSSKNFGAFTIDREAEITVQSNHVHATNQNEFNAIVADVNIDGLDDVILWDIACQGNATGCAGAGDGETAIYLQEDGLDGVMEGTNTAFTIGTDLDARDIATLTYDSGKAAVAYIDDSNELQINSTTDVGESATDNTIVNPSFGVVPYGNGVVTSSIGVIGFAANQLTIERVDIDSNDLSNALIDGGTVTVDPDATGGADVASISFVRHFDLEQDGDNDAVVAYIDSTDGLEKICVIGNDGTDLEDECSTRIIAPTNTEVREVKFADVAGDSLEDIVFIGFDTGTNESVIYVYENKNASFAGLFQQVDTLTLKTDLNVNVGYALGDINFDGLVDLIASDVKGDVDADGAADDLNTTYTIYYNTGNPSDIFSDLVESTTTGSTATGQDADGEVTFTAQTAGEIGNSISLVFDGNDDIDTVVDAWNLANPANQVAHDGDGTDVLDAQTINLAGADENLAFHYMLSGGNTVDLELIFNGTDEYYLLHCQVDTDAGAIATTATNSSCGIVGSFKDD